MIYTSFFSNKNNNIGVVIGIARITPKGIKQLINFAPSYDLVKAMKSKEISEKQYINYYLKCLDKDETIPIIAENLKEYENDKNRHLIFCCYCKTGFCHRHLLRKYLQEKYNLKIEELEEG